MAKVVLGNGSWLESYLRGAQFGGYSSCECGGTEVGIILTALAMAGSNLNNIYTGPKCVHGKPIKAAPVAYIVENYYEQAIKIKGRTNIKEWLSSLMKGSVALVFFRSTGGHSASALDLYLGNKLYINSGVDELADEMWVWCMGSPHKSLKKHKTKSHHKAIHVF